MTTYAQFMAALGALSVTGVSKTYGYGETPPASLNAADLPALWINLPEGDQRQMVSFASNDQWPTFSADIIVAVQPVAHKTAAEGLQATVEMMDAVTVALADARPAKTRPGWTQVARVVTVANIDYLAVVVRITASG